MKKGNFDSTNFNLKLVHKENKIYIPNGHIFHRTIYEQLVTFRYFFFFIPKRFPGFIFPPQATIRMCIYVWELRYDEGKYNIFSLCCVLCACFVRFLFSFRFYEVIFFVTFCE